MTIRVFAAHPVHVECFTAHPGVAKHSTRAMTSLRHRFPGIGPEWARFDGPAGTQMVDSAITAMSDWMASGNTAANGGPFAAAQECQRLMDRTRDTVGLFLGADPNGHQLRAQHDIADVRGLAGDQRHAAAG